MDRGMRAIAITLVVGLALALSACEGGGDPVEQAKQDALTANRAAAHPIDPALLEDNPAVATTAAASPADRAYVEAMIEHHRAAITTAQAALRQSEEPEIRRMAQQAIEASTAQIATLQAWRPATR